MTTLGPSPSKVMEDSSTAVSPSQPSGCQQALDVEDVIEFVEPLPKELQCPLCLEFLKEPTLTSCCGHHFCLECIKRSTACSHVCPLCNNQAFQTLLNKEKQRLVNTMKVYCKWKSRGCEWVGELGRLEHHLDMEEGDCGCVEVECEFGPVGCVAKLPRKDLQRHKKENVHKHLVLMSVMSLKSNEAFGRKLQEQQVELEGQLRQQQVEFQQQLKQKDEEIQAIQKSLQLQVNVSLELNDQLQQKNQQITNLQDELLQRGKQIATVQKNMEAKQQTITNLERQLKGEAEQLARVEVELTENAQQFVKLERRLRQVENSFWKEQNQVKELEEKLELWQIDKQVGAVQQSLEEKQQKIVSLEKQLQSRTEQLAQVEGKLTENSRQLAKMEEVLQNKDQKLAIIESEMKANEQKLVDVERKQQEEKLEINRQLAEVDRKVEEKGEKFQEVQMQFQQGNVQMAEEMTDLRRRIKLIEISLAEGQGKVIKVDEMAQKPGEQLVIFSPPLGVTMTDFEQHKAVEDDWYSPPFFSHTGGYKMCLRVHANGQGNGEGTHVSVYVHLMRGEHDDHLKWPFCGDITVQLLNQRREKEHMERTINFGDNVESKYKSRVTGRDRAGSGWGYRKFIAHSVLGYNSSKNTEYLRNDRLKFQVTHIKLKNL